MIDSPSGFSLGIDASTDWASVAIATAGGVCVQTVIEGHKRHALELLPSVQQLLASSQQRGAHCEVIGVDVGPGSFTGLRTACSMAQGLSLGWGEVPCVAFNSLALMAYQAYADGAAGGMSSATLLVTMDARLGQVYWAVFRFNGPQSAPVVNVLSEPALSTPQDAFAILHNHPVDVLVSHRMDQVAFDLDAALKSHVLTHIMAYPQAQTAARWALARLAVGDYGPARDCQPLYLRERVAYTTAERMAGHG